MSREPGWGLPGAARRWHYFPADQTMSLCHKWGFFLGTVEQGRDEHPDNCAACKRLLAAARRQPAPAPETVIVAEAEARSGEEGLETSEQDIALMFAKEKDRAIICDLDGTLCLFNGRGPFEMEKCGDDLPNNAVLATLRAFVRDGYRILLVSGRFERYREQTVDWLIRYRVGFAALLLRSDGDYRKDAEVKAEVYAREIAPHYRVALVLDDRDQSVAGWRALGLACFQVAPGNF